MSNAIFYAVGVGPGDPQLMTYQAVSIIEQSDYIAVPATKKEDSIAYYIASQMAALTSKPCLEISMPMTRNGQELSLAHNKAMIEICKVLKENKSVAFLTLGDPSIYATTAYLISKIERKGYQTQMISGVTSFTAAAAVCNIPLVLNDESLHIIPSSQPVEEALLLSGTKLFMKAGQYMKKIRDAIITLNKQDELDVYVVTRCGMPEEKVTRGLEGLEYASSYFSLVIVKEK